LFNPLSLLFSSGGSLPELFLCTKNTCPRLLTNR
jgi:hypothetical protein